MRLKDLFTVPTGQKVTERHLRRVLISSICSILLCMSCLAGATWAWFAVSIENTGNVIQIGEPKVNLTVDASSETDLSAGPHVVRIEHANEQDDLDKKSTLYVTLTIHCGDGTTTVYTILSESNNYTTEINIENSTGDACSLSWTASWFAPANAAELTDSTVILTAGDPTEPSTQPEMNPTENTTTETTTDTVTDPPSDPTAEPEDKPDVTQTESPNSEATIPNTELTESTTPTSTEGAADTTETVDGTEAAT